MGRPDRLRICTSIVERSNLGLRMGIRPFYPAHQEEIGRAARISHARSEGR